MELGPIQRRWIEELRSGRFKQGKKTMPRSWQWRAEVLLLGRPVLCNQRIAKRV